MTQPLALVIEDDYDAGVIMSEALRAAGYDVEVLRDGATAEARLSACQPTLIALDLHLPFVGGTRLLRQIRADERLKQTRVMLVTADDRLAESVADQANLVLLKPISFTQLMELARRLLPADPSA